MCVYVLWLSWLVPSQFLFIVRAPPPLAFSLGLASSPLGEVGGPDLLFVSRVTFGRENLA